MTRSARDLQEARLAVFLTAARRARARERVATELGLIVRKAFRLAGIEQQAPGAAACPVIAEAIRLVEARVASWAQGRSSFEWLFVFRRVEDGVFAGDLRSTSGYDRTLAEILSGTSGSGRNPEIVPPPDFSVFFSMDEGAAEHIARFCEGVRYLSQLHVAYRWAAKGAATTLRRDGIIRTDAPPLLRASARLCDERADHSPSHRAGTIVFDARVTRKSDVVLGAVPIQPTWLPCEIPQGGRAEVVARCIPVPMSIEQLRRLAPDLLGLGWPPELELLLLMARVSLIYAARHRAGILSLFQRGYLTGTTEFFDEIADELLADTDGFLAQFPARTRVRSGKELLSAAAGLTGRGWPLLPGPVVRPVGSGHTCVDVLNAWSRIHVLLEYPPGTGDVANLRAGHFEDAVQSAIDASLWRPGTTLASIRRRPLRRGGKEITDVDAIGERAGALLLVSCKSIVYTAEHDRGTHRVVRNAAATVRSAVSDWNDKITTLRAGPGENFDFSGYATVIGVVCTPHVVYVEIGPATAEVAYGLRASSSYAELVDWLSESPQHASPEVATT